MPAGLGPNDSKYIIRACLRLFAFHLEGVEYEIHICLRGGGWEIPSVGPLDFGRSATSDSKDRIHQKTSLAFNLALETQILRKHTEQQQSVSERRLFISVEFQVLSLYRRSNREGKKERGYQQLFLGRNKAEGA